MQLLGSEATMNFDVYFHSLSIQIAPRLHQIRYIFYIFYRFVCHNRLRNYGQWNDKIFTLDKIFTAVSKSASPLAQSLCCIITSGWDQRSSFLGLPSSLPNQSGICFAARTNSQLDRFSIEDDSDKEILRPSDCTRTRRQLSRRYVYTWFHLYVPLNINVMEEKSITILIF